MSQIVLKVKVEGVKKGCVGFYKEEYQKRVNDSQEVLHVELLEIAKRYRTITRVEFVAEELQGIKPFDPKKSIKLQKIWDGLMDRQFE